MNNSKDDGGIAKVGTPWETRRIRLYYFMAAYLGRIQTASPEDKALQKLLEEFQAIEDIIHGGGY